VVLSLDGCGGAGRQSGSQPQPVFVDVTGSRERRVLWIVRDHGKVLELPRPFIFAWAALTFNSSRPAVLSLIVFFIVGGYLLTRVNVVEGRRIAQEEDARLLGGQPAS
jgi:hypothetical protein